MKTKILLLCFTIAVIPFLGGCKKYEDGPAFSLRSAKGRLANTWKFELVKDPQGVDVTSYYTKRIWEFQKDGTCILTDGSFGPSTGTWVFSDSKKNIVVTVDSYGLFPALIILKLENKEFWCTPGDGYEYHMIPK